MIARRPFVMSASLLMFILAAVAQTKQPSGPRIQSLMTATEFKSCGLNKLSADEISHLNEWLMTFAGKVKIAVRNVETRTPSVIESEIDRDFNGWSGETIFELTNGQIWQQTEYDYEYEYAYRPAVTIYKTDTGYKMKVEGMEDTIHVKRIK